MKEEYRIKEGDIVRVDFNCAQTTLCFEAEVISVRYNTMDSWIFKDKQNNCIHYVSEPCTITKKILS